MPPGIIVTAVLSSALRLMPMGLLFFLSAYSWASQGDGVSESERIELWVTIAITLGFVVGCALLTFQFIAALTKRRGVLLASASGIVIADIVVFAGLFAFEQAPPSLWVATVALAFVCQVGLVAWIVFTPREKFSGV